MKFLFLSHTYAGGIYVVGSHHLSRELVRRGHDVLHISTPLSIAHRLRGNVDSARAHLAASGLTEREGVLEAVPNTVFPAPLAHRYARSLLQRSGLGSPDFVMIDQPAMAHPALRRLGAPIVYRPTDIYLRGAVARHQARAIRLADAVIATSVPVLESLRLRDGIPTRVITNGAEVGRFLSADERVAPRTGAIYVGSLDRRFDWGAVAWLAETNPEVPIDIYGTGQRPPRPLPPSVSLRGPLDYSRVPTALRSKRVGLLPLSNDPSNQGRSPMKLYEYLASGLHVVSAATAAIRTDEAAGIYTYVNYNEASRLFSIALQKDRNVAGEAKSLREGWEVKAEEVEIFVLSLVG